MATYGELLRLIQDYEPRQKLVNLTMDEMYICEGVVYNKHCGQIIAFTDIGLAN